MSCCSASYDKPLSMHQRNSRCMPIPVPHDDKYIGQKNVGCMNFVRAQPALNKDCELGGSPIVIHFLAVQFNVEKICQK